MAALKYSRQRESIKQYLSVTKEHPSADMVYVHVKEQFPNISLGTVYRNLNLLIELGEIIKLPIPVGGDRFDGNTAPHNHFVCTNCGKIFDIDVNEEQLNKLNRQAAEKFDGKIESSQMVFYGKCSDCIKSHNS